MEGFYFFIGFYIYGKKIPLKIINVMNCIYKYKMGEGVQSSGGVE